MPNGTGKTARVLVFAKGAKAEEATAAGADFVGSDELVAKINGGWLDFDVVIATPELIVLYNNKSNSLPLNVWIACVTFSEFTKCKSRKFSRSTRRQVPKPT